MVQGAHVRAVGHPSECSKNLATALEELRRRENIEWVIEKLEAAGFMESKTKAVDASATGRKKATTEGPGKTKRQLLTRCEDGGLPVEGLKWVIRELKLNTGQNFWKNHVTREDFLKVLLFHFKARQPIRTKTATAAETRGAALTTTSNRRGASSGGAASNYERIRQGLILARNRHEIAAESSTAYATPSYIGLLTPYQKGRPREEAKRRSSSSTRPLVEKGWRDFQEDHSQGMLYQTRVGLNRNWRSVRDIALGRTCPKAAGLEGTLSNVLAALGNPITGDGGNSDDTSDDASEPRDTETERQEEEARLMRRKCARSIYELSTRADKGPLLIENGVLDALSVLSLVEDPWTTRYVGAAYVNIASLGREVCAEMLKNQVVRCLHRLWRRGCSLAYHRQRSDSDSGGTGPNNRRTIGSIVAEMEITETDEEWQLRKCGLDVLDQAAVALCRLTMPKGSESIMMHERGLDAIMWYSRDEHHGNERLKVMGLQCLINFHRNTPTGAFHEAILPCLTQLGQSATTGIRRFTGQAICSLGVNKQGASQLLAGGVLTILANLSNPQQQHANLCDGGGNAGAHDGLLLEACAQAASNLTSAQAEFVRQALVAPATVAEVLDILYLGGDGGGGIGSNGGGSERGAKRAAACRLNSARVLRSIFSEADASDVARLVQLGFLLKLGQFFGQAEARKDPKAQGLLTHSAWYLSMTLTDVKPVAVPPVVNLHGEDGVSVLSEVRPSTQQHKGGCRSSFEKSVHDSATTQGGARGPRTSRRGSSGGSSCAMSTTRSEANAATQATVPRGTTVVGAAATGAQSVPDRARFSVTSRTGSRNCAGQGGLSGARAARGLAAEKGPGTGSTLAAAAAVGKGEGRRLGGGSSVVDSEEDTVSETSSWSKSGAGGVEGGVQRGWGLPLDPMLQESGASSGSLAAEVVVDTGPHVVSCGVMNHLLSLAETGTTGFIRECSAGALCNLARKPWITTAVCKETGIIQTFLKSIIIALARGEEGTSTLAAKGVWNLVSRMSQDKEFIQECLSLGVVGSLCGAARGAADLLVALDEAAAEEAGERPGPTTSFAESVTSDLDVFDEYNDEGAGDVVFRRQMRATAKACLRSIHAILKHKWVRLDPVVQVIREDLLTMLVSCSAGGTQVKEVAMGIMCNLSHDACCDLAMLEKTGALHNMLGQTFSPSRVVLRHLSGVLGNISSIMMTASNGNDSLGWTRRGITLFDCLRRLAYLDDSRVAFRASAILYGLTRKRDYVDILPDLKGLGDIVFKLFRAGVPQTQNYCLQAFCNMAHNKDFAASIASDQEMMEDFIVGCLVHTNSSHMKEMSSEVMYYLISNPSTRRTALRGQGLWALVQLAAANRSAVSMRLALLALFNLTCDLRENARWLNENTVAAVLDFDDEVLGAPAFTGLLYLASTHHGRLSQMLVSTRMAQEARIKIKGAKFLKRDRAQEEDKKFMARATAALRPDEADGDDSSSDEDNATDRRRSYSMSKFFGSKQRGRLRCTFVASYLMPTLATVYNLCCKRSATATKLFFREGIPEAVAGLLEELRTTKDDTYYHPQVEIMCMAVLGTMIEDATLVPKLIERHVTPAITQGLASRIVPVRLASLWSLLLLGIPGSGTRSGVSRNSAAASSSPTTDKDHTGGLPLRMWMLFCREAVVECKAVSALCALWEGGTAASLGPEAREHVRYAISTVTRIFFMDKVAASAAVRQRGAELLAMTMDFSEQSRARAPWSICEEDFEYDESSSPIVKVQALSCAAVTVHLPDIPWDSVRSVCEGCLDVFLEILPTHDDEVRDLCSLVMRCLAGHEELLLDLLAEPRFTTVLQMLLEDATPAGGVNIVAVLQRVVVLSAAPGVPDLSPALLNLTDYVFQRRSPTSKNAASLGSSSSLSSSASIAASTPRGGHAASTRAVPRSVHGSTTRSSNVSVSVPGGRGAGAEAGKGFMGSISGGGNTRPTARPISGPKSFQSSLASGGASGSVENIRARRMTRIMATQKASSAHPGKGRTNVFGVGSALDSAGADAAAGAEASKRTTGVENLTSKFNVFRHVAQLPDGTEDLTPSGGPDPDDTNHLNDNLNHNITKTHGQEETAREIGLGSATPAQEEGAAEAAAAAESAAEGTGGLSAPDIVVTRATGVMTRAKPVRNTAAEPLLTATRVGKHESVAVWGLTPAAVSCHRHQDCAGPGSVGISGRGDFEANSTGLGQQWAQQGMLERLNDGDDDDASDSTQSSGDDNELEITYNDDEIRQVKRLVFRVVEAELSTTVVESVMEVVTQLREVARKQCTAFQQRSEEYRTDVLKTRKGEALALPHSNRPSNNGEGEGASSRESTPDSDISTTSLRSKASTRPPATNWDPAKQLLVLMGMEPLPMVPGWEFSSTQNLKTTGGPKKVNLCTTKFVDDSKTLPSTEVAVPIPLPAELAHFTQRGDAEMPTGLERCILPPLERPTPEKAVSEISEAEQETYATSATVAAAAAAVAAVSEAEHPTTEESESISGDAVPDTSSSFNVVGTRHARRASRRGSGGYTKVSGPKAFRRSRYNINHHGIALSCQEPGGDSPGGASNAKHNNIYGRAGRRKSSRTAGGEHSGLEGEMGHGEYAPTDAARGCLGFPRGVGGRGRESEGGGLARVSYWGASDQSIYSLEAKFAASPLWAALSLAGDLSPAPFMTKEEGTDARAGGCFGGEGRSGGPNIRSAVPALAADTNSLRTKRLLEEREEGRERQKLLKSLGVGTRRSLTRFPGKRGGARLVTTVVASPRRPRPPHL